MVEGEAEEVGEVEWRDVVNGLTEGMEVCVCRASSAARWRRSNSACWSAGRRGGEGDWVNVEEGRVEVRIERGRVVRFRERRRRRDIVAVV